MLDLSKHPLRRRYDLDSAMSTIWEHYKKWFVPLFSISFVASLLTNMLATRIDISSLQQTTDPLLLLEALKPFVSQYFIIALVGLLFSLFLQYYVIVRPVDQEGTLLDWGSKVLIRFFLPMLVVYIVLGIFTIIAISLGLVLLIVGAFFAIFYVLIFFTLATPVMMVEDASISTTIKRVFTLGHKKFGIALAWTALYVLLIIIVSLIFSMLIMIPFSGGAIRSILNPEAARGLMEFTKNPAYIILAAATGALTMPLQSIFALVLYFNIRSYEDESQGFNSGSEPGGRVTVDDLYGNNDS